MNRKYVLRATRQMSQSCPGRMSGSLTPNVERPRASLLRYQALNRLVGVELSGARPVEPNLYVVLYRRVFFVLRAARYSVTGDG